MNASLLTPLLALALAVPQEPQPQELQRQEPRGTLSGARTPLHPAHRAAPDAPSAADLGVDLFYPRHADPDELAMLASEVLGRLVTIESGTLRGLAGPARERFVVIGGGVAVIDTDEARARHLAVLGDLDRQIGDRAREQREAETADRVVAVSFTPRHVSIATARSAIGGDVADWSGTPPLQSAPLDGVGTLVLRGRQSDVDRALGLLRSIDVPRPQLLLTVHAIAAAAGSADGGPATDEGLPQELVDGLGALVPGTDFEHLGSASVRTTVSSSPVTLESALRDGETLLFQGVPSAFDEEGGQLFVDRCTLVVRPSGEVNGGRRSVAVETSVTLAVGEYAVLAAVGSERTYFVVHATRH